MKKSPLVWLLPLAVMLAVGIISGCKTVLSRQIVDTAQQNALDLKRIQYYISDTIILENEKNARYMTYNVKGKVFLENNAGPERIVIKRGAAGTLIGYSTPNPDKPLILEVCFTTDSNDSLLFMENPRTQRFELMYTQTAEGLTVAFGNEKYLLTFNKTPSLVIKLQKSANVHPYRTVLPSALIDPPETWPQ
ncbi:hypothetical protein FACS1894142_0030 [Spirochaetia bacterium]|nr:hypothetical protein FACS1894142_0030 [Spirochaetia bacterium]